VAWRLSWSVVLLLLAAAWSSVRTGAAGPAGPAGPLAPRVADLAPGAAEGGERVDRRILGYYVSYDPASWASLEAQAASIDVVAVQWVTIDACGRLASRDDQTLKQFARSRGIRVFPSLLTFSGWLNHRLLTDDETSARAVGEIVEYVVSEGYDGFDLDLEGVRPEDRAAYTGFVGRLAAALRDRGKALALAVPGKTADTTTGWGGAFDYAALGVHADLITVMAYEYRGPWSGPGSVAPYDWVDQVLAFATSQIPPDKVLLGLAFYGYDWNTTSGGARYLGYPEVAALGERYGGALVPDPETGSTTFRYRAPGGERPPAGPAPPAPTHEITIREPPPCPVVDPTPTPAARPTPVPEGIQEHEVWLEGSASAAARLGLAERYRTGGVAAWRLGHEEPSVWELLGPWRAARP
jgi:spore germination protein YaaH